MDKEYLIKKWLDNSLSDSERKVFEQSDDFQKLSKLSDAIQAFKAPKYDINEELNQLSVQNEEKTKIRSINWVKTLLPIAAMLFIVMGGFFYFYMNGSVTIQTAAAEKSILYLPDSTQVTLNANSKISYNSKTWTDRRSVKLEGEAYFEVKKGSKFDVNTVYGMVSVLGTHFNVNSRKNYFEVICFEGLVQVQADRYTTKLPANHAVRKINGIITESSASEELSPSWLNNESSFHSVPFAQVVEEFERQYNIGVSLQHVDKNQLFTGGFVHNNQTSALQEITLPLNLTYEITKDNLIILTGKVD